MAASLRLEFLGGLRVTSDGVPVIGFVSSKVQALLCYLAITGRPHFRPALAALLWGDQPEADAATNLRQALTNLRRLLDPYVVITRQTVAFNREQPYWLDVEQFEAGLAAGSTDDIHTLAIATALYRGDFLDGFIVRDAPEFDEWALAERERLRERALAAMHALAVRHTERGEYAAGIAAAARVLALDPWREDTHCQLMLLLARSGQRAAALAQYETCRRILRDELGVEPMPETTALYDRIHAAHSAATPPIRTPATPLIGRDDERAKLARCLADPACHLLTIVGLGGVGKTRLALQAAIDHRAGFLNGTYFVALAPVTSPDMLISSIADAVEFSFYHGDDPRTQLFNYLRGKELLLVLDNFEQLIEAGADVLAEILRRAPDVKLLVTSRERVQLHGEWLIELHGLRVPPQGPTNGIESYSAVQLFLNSARRVHAALDLSNVDAQALARICRLVGGIPLGIELAAAWTRILSCAEIAQEIEAGLDFLATSLRDVPDRQRSMRAVFDHSWRLLSTRERAVFQRLSVFRGHFTRAAANAICSELNIEHLKNAQYSMLNLLSSLADKSLLRRNQASRYELHELVRQYAADKLQECGEQTQARDLHCAYYAELLHQKQEALQGSAQQQAKDEISTEIENVRAAWQWAVASRKIDAIERALESLYRFYDIGGWFQEGAVVLESAVAALEGQAKTIAVTDDQHSVLLGKLLVRQSWFCNRLGRYIQAEELLQKSLTLFRRTSHDVRREIALALTGLGNLAILAGDYPRARSLSQEALAHFQVIGDQLGIADACNNLGIVADVLGEYQQAKHYYQANLTIHTTLGDRKGIARATHNLADTTRLLGEYLEARRLHQACLEIARAIGDQLLEAYSVACVGIATGTLGEHAAARQFLQEGLTLFQTIGHQAGIELCYNHLGIVSCTMGDYQAAERAFHEALKITLAIHAIPEMLEVLGGLATNMAKTGETERPIELLAVIAGHPASYQHTREDAQRTLAELRGRVPEELATAAYSRGLARDLVAAVEAVVGGR